MKKIVFTGGFSSGKTTIINILKNLGYTVVAESSEFLINEYKSNYNCYPWDNKDNLLDFHKKVFYNQLKNERLFSDDLVFFDRSVLDRLAFLEFDKLQIPDKLLELAKLCCYDKILFFESNEAIYKIDSHRPQNIKDSKIAEELMKKVYKDLGYTIDIIPFCSVDDRLKIILEKICK